jgi:lipid-binding SYLF domain-containing protein
VRYGARGQGVLYEQERHTAYCDLTQATVGLQAGGQSFSELLVFEDKAALDRFKAGQLAFATDASAVVLKTGVATSDAKRVTTSFTPVRTEADLTGPAAPTAPGPS